MTLPGILFLVASFILIATLEKKYLIIPLLLTAFYMTYGQLLIIAGFHFTLLRLIIVAYWIRMLVRGEFHWPIKNGIDKIFLLYVLYVMIINTTLWGTFAAFQTNLGTAFDAVGLYVPLRIYVDNYNSILFSIKAISIIILPVAVIMLFESQSGINAYSFLGGVPEFSMMREGWVRAQGPFRHPILAGTVGAATIPLFIALYVSKTNKMIFPLIGIVSSLIILYASHSSGPLLTFIASILGFMFWWFRDRMRFVRWSILAFLFLLSMIMKSPIWFIFARLGDVFGGGGYHRSRIIDQAVKHIGDWWLIGTKYTGDWIPYTLGRYPGQADITNAYIGAGVSGGLLAMILFILVIVRCFAALGDAQKIKVHHPLGNRFSLWAIGVSLLVHVVTFFSVSYFDQIIVFWYLLLATISSISDIHQVKA